ncbi:EAL domain-containing protein [Candidatus Litorirhabdus singularis]|uniref:bifunctional diguanylate cyclase/phosphodiesterase n=1 Tax=Candidatus Litorirhabdus singularis TaxID=2518993 RepID=UPI00242BD36E|nr:EAL domain-containing protein [Candidatus Litorirhabdus singularis]
MNRVNTKPAYNSPNNSRITRQLFSIFFLFALLPVSILSYVALETTAAASRNQSTQALEDKTKTLSYLVLNRLVFAEKTLGLATTAEETPDNRAKSAWVGLDYNSFQMTPQQQQQLALGGYVVSATTLANPALKLIRAIEPERLEAGFQMVPLTETLILGEEESRNLSIDSCVFTEHGLPLFSSHQQLCAELGETTNALAGHKGMVKFGLAETEYQASFRTLFLQDRYQGPNWKVAVIQKQDDLTSAASLFKSNFLLLALLVILSLSLASILLIRRRMSPLSDIMEGIARVSEQRYDTPVQVTTKDEFNDLATAINGMSHKVSSQLNMLESLAALDQLILTRSGRDTLLQAVIERTRELLAIDAVGILIIEYGEDGEHTTLQTCNTLKQLNKRTVALQNYQQAQLLQEDLWLSKAGGRHDDIFETLPHQITEAHLLPVRNEGGVNVVLLLGYQKREDQGAEHTSVINTYIDRIAVALANSDSEERLFRQAKCDSLTDLPNRLSMLERLNSSINHSERSGQSFALLFIDLDDFKLVNDSLGHIAGDDMITAMATRLKENIRDGDMVARMGGDEFVVISDYFDNGNAAATRMAKLCDKIMKVVDEPMQIHGREIRSGTSIGVAIYPRDGLDANILLRNADAAMYHAKDKGRGNYQFFSESLNTATTKLMELSSELKRALENNEFVLHYQPKYETKSGAIVGAEALIRWQHPERGLLAPGQFIDAAERMGLITAIGDQTMGIAARQIQLWSEQGLNVPRIALNMSAVQVQQEDVVEKLISWQKVFGIPYEKLEIEIVEGVLVKDIDVTSEKLNRIRELGVEVSIDDYGTGYSSLSYIRSLPVDTLKLDRCFITNLCSSKADRAIVSSTILLAHELGLRVIAEGVETLAQLQLLKQLDCDEVQGFYLSKPLSQENLAILLSDRQDGAGICQQVSNS